MVVKNVAANQTSMKMNVANLVAAGILQLILVSLQLSEFPIIGIRFLFFRIKVMTRIASNLRHRSMSEWQQALQ